MLVRRLCSLQNGPFSGDMRMFWGVFLNLTSVQGYLGGRLEVCRLELVMIEGRTSSVGHSTSWRSIFGEETC